jgi:hypothetical protein
MCFSLLNRSDAGHTRRNELGGAFNRSAIGNWFDAHAKSFGFEPLALLE